jgi:isopentenyl diphosphate isomerase/L-lactate dehydrogenase-like FMN-dependent dehydrogenase
MASQSMTVSPPPAPAPTQFTTLGEVYETAPRMLSPEAWAYLDGGAGAEETLADNLRAFQRWRLRPRCLAGVVTPSTATQFLGMPLAAPILTAPIGSDILFHPDGQCATVRAAARRGIVPVVSEASHWPLETVAACADGPKVMQLHAWGGRDEFLALVERAERAGFSAICVTIDCPTLGWRERIMRRRFTPRDDAWTGNCVGPPGAAAAAAARLSGGRGSEWTWETLADARPAIGLPVMVKGVLTAEDAEAAVAAGVDAVVVSNHGGRQLDGVPATLDQLPEVLEAGRGRVAVALDGGIRRGTDVLKALALGADVVLVGRAAAMGLAAAGEPGVAAVLRLLVEELERSMLLAGRADLREIDRSLVRRSAD